MTRDPFTGYRRKLVYSPRSRRGLVRTTPRVEPRITVPRRVTKSLVAILLITAFFWWLLASDSFRVNTIEVRGIKGIASEEIEREVMREARSARAFFFLPRTSIWVFPTDDAKQALEQKFPSLREVRVERRPAHTVVVTGREETGSIIWQSGEVSYLISGAGEAIQVLGAEADPQLVRVRDGAAIPVEIGQKVTTPGFIRFVRAVAGEWKKMTGTGLAELRIPETTLELHARSEEGWTAYFDTTREAGPQLEHLGKILGKIRGEQKTPDYIDLRVDGRIFYKTK